MSSEVVKFSQRSDRKRQLILDTAARLFSEGGLKRTNLDMLATELGLTRPAIYHYFQGKDAVVSACIEAGHEAWLEMLGAYDEDSTSPTERLRGIVFASVEWKRSLYGRFMSSIAINDLDDKVKQLKASYHKQTIDALAKLIAEGMAAGEFRYGNPETAARVVWGCLYWYGYDLECRSKNRMVEDTIDFVLEGLLTRDG